MAGSGVSPAETVTDWSGLRASLALVMGLGLCGLPFSGPGVGGSTGTPSPDLYLRWFRLAAFSRRQEVTCDAPLERLPVLARAGAVIPVVARRAGWGLEVWTPPPGVPGSGLLVRDAGDGWSRPLVERLTVRVADGRTEVVTEDGRPVGLGLRVLVRG